MQFFSRETSPYLWPSSSLLWLVFLFSQFWNSSLLTGKVFTSFIKSLKLHPWSLTAGTLKMMGFQVRNLQTSRGWNLNFSGVYLLKEPLSRSTKNRTDTSPNFSCLREEWFESLGNRKVIDFQWLPIKTGRQAPWKVEASFGISGFCKDSNLGSTHLVVNSDNKKVGKGFSTKNVTILVVDCNWVGGEPNSIYLILSDDSKLDVVLDIELVVQQYGKGCLLPKRESVSAKSSSSLPMSIFFKRTFKGHKNAWLTVQPTTFNNTSI